jgi:hypothetical protein
MRKPDPEAVAHRDIVAGKTIELISTLVFVGCWIAVLILLATPMPPT